MAYLVVVILSLFISYVLAYKAAVLDYHPLISDTPMNTILHNLNQYRNFADDARAQGADIVVFPEYGLTSMVKNPKEYAVEIDLNNAHFIIRELSSMAVERQMYLVVNLLEKGQEESNETKYYNTNLVFEKSGAIITKYRKINLFQEPKLTSGLQDQNHTFTTDFSVTFATFTGFDVLFSKASQAVLANEDISDVVLPTAWPSMMPFHTALSVQHGYAVANGVNLLAANYVTPENARGGSGIYSADGAIKESHIAGSGTSKLIIQEVSRRYRKQDKTCPTPSIPISNLDNLVGNDVSDYINNNSSVWSGNFINVNVSHLEIFSTTVCHGKIFCSFDIVVDTSKSSLNIYKVMAYDGLIRFDKTDVHISVCSLVACENDSNVSCGVRINTTTTFKNITVSGYFEKNDSMVHRPVTLNSFLLPITHSRYCDESNETTSSFKLSTEKVQQGVLVFGILGSRDAGDVIKMTTLDPNNSITSSNGIESAPIQRKNIPSSSVPYHAVVFIVFISVIKSVLL